VLASFTVRDVAAGAEVLRQGEEGREAFIVVRGALRVVRRGEEGRDTLLAVLGPALSTMINAIIAESKVPT
jgi:CRP-like cAMP-binding protein